MNKIQETMLIILDECLKGLEDIDIESRENTAEAFLSGHLSNISEQIENCEVLQSVVSQITEIYEHWTTEFNAIKPHKTKKKKKRTSKKKRTKSTTTYGHLTPKEIFEKEITSFLRKHKGKAVPRAVVVQHLNKVIKLNRFDREPIPSKDDRPKWTMNVDRAVKTLIKKKIIKRKKGLWQIIAKSRK